MISPWNWRSGRGVGSEDPKRKIGSLGIGAVRSRLCRWQAVHFSAENSCAERAYLQLTESAILSRRVAWGEESPKVTLVLGFGMRVMPYKTLDHDRTEEPSFTGLTSGLFRIRHLFSR